MTVQTVNSFSMLFMQNSGNRVDTEKGQDFDSFLRADSQELQVSGSAKPSHEVTTETAEVNRSVINQNEKSQTEYTVSETEKTEETDDTVIDDVAVDVLTCMDSEELPDEVLAEILAVLNDFVTTIQNVLGADTEQLLDAAEQIQFGLSDFFDTDKIKELFLQVTGADTTQLLTDEGLYKSLEHLQEMFDEILQGHEVLDMLQQEGFDPNQFDPKAFDEQLIEFVRTELQVDEVVPNVEKVVEFDFGAEKINRFDFDSSDTVLNTAETDSADVQSFDTETGQEQHSSGTEHSFNQAGLFLQKLVDSVNRSTEDVLAVPDTFGLYDIAAQIIEQVKIHIRPESTKMEMQLNPEQLGKVELEISSKNGELSAKLNVQNDQVKEAVESQMQVLRETLEAQGLKVENIEVTVAEFGFRFQDESTDNGQQQQRRFRNTVVDFDEAEAADDQSYSDVAEVMRELNGNTVDYVA